MSDPLQITVAIVTYRPPHRTMDMVRPTLVPYYSREEAEQGKDRLMQVERVVNVELIDMEQIWKWEVADVACAFTDV